MRPVNRSTAALLRPYHEPITTEVAQGPRLPAHELAPLAQRRCEHRVLTFGAAHTGPATGDRPTPYSDKTCKVALRFGLNLDPHLGASIALRSDERNDLPELLLRGSGCARLQMVRQCWLEPQSHVQERQVPSRSASSVLPPQTRVVLSSAAARRKPGRPWTRMLVRPDVAPPSVAPQALGEGDQTRSSPRHLRKL
jgi:hypothetical protein